MLKLEDFPYLAIPGKMPIKRCQKDIKIGRFSVPGNTGEDADKKMPKRY
jgi:hypothetical protein